MLVVIFSRNRPQMLRSLLGEMTGSKADVVVIDDGSDRAHKQKGVTLLKTGHEGKKGFWKKWVMARQIALGSGHDYFLFLPDDISNLNLSDIEELTRQGWDENLFAVNIINCGRDSCWGRYSTGQEDIKIGDTILKEVGFVDCGFLTNRYTLTHVDVPQVHESWFDRPDKSSGVGYFMTENMRQIGTKMMMPFPGLCYHGQHDSVMHPKERKRKPLTT